MEALHLEGSGADKLAVGVKWFNTHLVNQYNTMSNIHNERHQMCIVSEYRLEIQVRSIFS